MHCVSNRFTAARRGSRTFEGFCLMHVGVPVCINMDSEPDGALSIRDQSESVLCANLARTLERLRYANVKSRRREVKCTRINQPESASLISRGGDLYLHAHYKVG